MITKTFESYDQALQFIRAYERDNGYKFLVNATASGFTDKLSSIFHRKVLGHHKDLPYLHVSNGKTSMFCGLGGRKYEKYRKQTDTSTVTGQRKRTWTQRVDPSKNNPQCSSEIRISSFVYFPDYKVDEDMKKPLVTKKIDHLRKNFTTETARVYHFIVEIDETHSNHRKTLPQALDSRVTDMLQTLVERGYYTASDIQEQLDKYYSTLPINPQVGDPKFYPGSERIRRVTYPLVVKQRNLEREKGYTADLTEAITRMKDFENDTCTNYICTQRDGAFGQKEVFEASRTNLILTSPDSDLRCRIETGGVPYMILATQLYECSHGVDYRNKYTNQQTPNRRKHSNREGMTMCTAKCIFKEVAMFPAYRIDSSVKQRSVRDAIMEKLKDDLSNKTAVYEKVIAYAFPCVDEHCGHAVREANGHLLLDESIKSQIKELVLEGVRSVAEMRRHLKMYLKHHFGELSMPGPFNKKYRPSNQTIVSLMYEAGVPYDQIQFDVKDPVFCMPRMSDLLGVIYQHTAHVTSEPLNSMDTEAQHDPPVTGIQRTTMENDHVPGSENQLNSLKTSELIDPITVTATNVATVTSQTVEQSTDPFQDMVFRKQSECQGLLEEILQDIYQIFDMFRLRDLRELFKRVRLCLKKGQLLCDVIPVRGENDKQKMAKNNNNHASTVCAVTTETSSLEEPPTKLLILDQKEQVTEVDLPKDCESSEIVIYQEEGDLIDKILLVNQNGEIEEANTLYDTSTNSKSDRNHADNCEQRVENRKDLIRVKCKQYVSNEEILKNLELSEIGRKLNLNGLDDDGGCKGRRGTTRMSSVQKEIKAQEKELIKFERDKLRLVQMETKALKEEERPVRIGVNISRPDRESLGKEKRRKASLDRRDRDTIDTSKGINETGKCVPQHQSEGNVHRTHADELDETHTEPVNETTACSVQELNRTSHTKDSTDLKFTAVCCDFSVQTSEDDITMQTAEGEESDVPGDKDEQYLKYSSVMTKTRHKETRISIGTAASKLSTLKPGSTVDIQSLTKTPAKKSLNKKPGASFTVSSGGGPSVPSKTLSTQSRSLPAPKPLTLIAGTGTMLTKNLSEQKLSGQSLSGQPGLLVPTSQTVQTGFVTINNVLYSNTPVGFFPALNSRGLPLLVNTPDGDKLIGGTVRITHQHESSAKGSCQNQTMLNQNNSSLTSIKSYTLTADDSGILKQHCNSDQSNITIGGNTVLLDGANSGNRGIDHEADNRLKDMSEPAVIGPNSVIDCAEVTIVPREIKSTADFNESEYEQGNSLTPISILRMDIAKTKDELGVSDSKQTSNQADSLKSSHEKSPGLTMRTRGRHMRFSRSGEKLS